MNLIFALIQISLKFIPKGPINNRPVLVQIMSWCQTGDKPLSEIMMVKFTDAYNMYHGQSSNAQVPTNADCFNTQTARILISHKGPAWAWEAQVLSHLYVCNSQINITYHVLI